MGKAIAGVQPLVTVFMAVYNGAAYIAQSIDGVLAQTYSNFELLIVNDGSTDDSVAIIHRYTDPRIRLLHNDQNRGLFFTRNRGIEEAAGDFFAINDCDDLAAPDRLEKQLAFLNAHPDCAFCGSAAYSIDGTATITGILPVPAGTAQVMKGMLLFSNIAINSTLMFRTTILREFRYREGYEPAEDYDLTTRMADAGYTVCNTDDLLMYYRIHGQNVSVKKAKQREVAEHDIVRRQLVRLGIDPSWREMEIQLSLLNMRDAIQDYQYDDYAQWIKRLWHANHVSKIYLPAAFRHVLFLQLYKVARNKKQPINFVKLICCPYVSGQNLLFLGRSAMKMLQRRRKLGRVLGHSIANDKNVQV